MPVQRSNTGKARAKGRGKRGGGSGGGSAGKNGFSSTSEAPGDNQVEVIPSSSLTHNDVLSGKGPRIQNHPGNVKFRALVASRRDDYAIARRHKDKHVVAQEIVAHVSGRGAMRVGTAAGEGTGLEPPGRFLVLLSAADARGYGYRGGDGGKATPPLIAGSDLWRPANDDMACEKVKQAFRNLSKGLITDPAPPAKQTRAGGGPRNGQASQKQPASASTLASAASQSQPPPGGRRRRMASPDGAPSHTTWGVGPDIEELGLGLGIGLDLAPGTGPVSGFGAMPAPSLGPPAVDLTPPVLDPLEILFEDMGGIFDDDNNDDLAGLEELAQELLVNDDGETAGGGGYPMMRLPEPAPFAPGIVPAPTPSSQHAALTRNIQSSVLPLVRQMVGAHAEGRPQFTSSENEAGSSMEQQDLVRLGEFMHTSLTGGASGKAAIASPISTGQQIKRRDGSGVGGRLCDLGLPTSLSVCVSSLLDAADASCPERYRSAAEVEADLVLMVSSPERYLFGHASVNERLLAPTTDRLPDRLYGRSLAMAELNGAFDRVVVQGGLREVVLVKGYAGTGKSALVRQLCTPLATHNGHFVTADFDEMGHVQPMSVIFQAFDNYCRAISGAETHVRLLRNATRAALGPHDNVLTDLMPNLRLLMGEEATQTKAVPLGRIETLNRFIHYFRLFVRAIASKKTPVVFYFDNLQWADKGSLELIANLASDPKLSSMLFVGCYRDDIAGHPGHPLNSEMNRIQLSGILTTYISLGNLDVEMLNEFISDTFNLTPRITRPLANAVHAKTTGNIHFAVQLLRSLYDDCLLRYSARDRRWEWDVEAIESRDVDDNVVDLMTRKMLTLNQNVQVLLKVAACLGSRCNKDTLVKLLGTNPSGLNTVTSSLEIVISEGLISKIGPNHYKFSHDQIAQAAYTLITVEKQEALHLSIGRKMRKNATTADALRSDIDVIVDQLCRGSSLITDENERIEVARLCLIVGKKALSTSAFTTAARHLLQATVLLNKRSFVEHYDLSLEIHSSLAEAEYATGNHGGISIAVEPILKHGRNLKDKMQAYLAIINSLGAQGQQAKAIKSGTALLSMHGYNFPPSPDINESTEEIHKTQSILQSINVFEIATRPTIIDKKGKSAIHILFILARHAHIVNQNLMSIMVCRMIQISIEYGVCVESSFAFAAYGYVMTKFAGLEEAYKYGKVATALLDRFDSKEVLARVVCVLNDFLIFKEPLQARLPTLKNAYEVGISIGDIEWGLTVANVYTIMALQCGRPLNALADEAKGFMQQMRLYNHHTLVVASLYSRFIANLTGTSDRGDPTDFGDLSGSDEIGTLTQEVRQTSVVNRAHFLRLWMAYLFGKYDLAAEMAESRWKMANSRPLRSTSLVNETLFTGLVAVVMASGRAASRTGPATAASSSSSSSSPSSSSSSPEKWRAVAHSALEEMQKWAAHSDWNFSHKVKLLEAEIGYWLLGDEGSASSLYADAIRLSTEHSFGNDRALALERAGLFHAETSPDPAVGRKFMQMAYEAYLEWGSFSKARQLQERYAHWGLQGPP